MSKILLLGDRLKPRYHSLEELWPLLLRLEELHEVTINEEYPWITRDYLNSFDLVLNYIDNWQERGNTDAELELYKYMLSGGRMLSLHNGIILKPASRLLSIHGASFCGHAEYDLLMYKKSSKDHAITQDLEDFSLYEEPYEFEFVKDQKIELLLEYYRHQKAYPAAWTISEGQGKLVYLAFGHNRETFVQKPVQELVLRSIDWLLQ